MVREHHHLVLPRGRVEADAGDVDPVGLAGDGQEIQSAARGWVAHGEQGSSAAASPLDEDEAAASPGSDDLRAAFAREP